MLTQDHELHRLLDSVADTREIVVRRADADDALVAAWEDARDEANEAWSRWAAEPSGDRWAVYDAARDREGAALAALAASPPSAPALAG